MSILPGCIGSEIVLKGKLTSFEEQTEDNRLFLPLRYNFNPLALLLVFASSSFSSFSYLIPAMHSGKIDMSPSLLR